MSPSEPHSGVEAMSVIKETLLHAEQLILGEAALMMSAEVQISEFFL